MFNTQFYELLNIPKIEYTTPGRCVDDDNEICDYYCEYHYPSILPVFFDVLDYYLYYMNGEPFGLREVSTPKLCKKLQNKVVERLLYLSNYHSIEQEQQELYDIFDDYYYFEGRNKNGN